MALVDGVGEEIEIIEQTFKNGKNKAVPKEGLKLRIRRTGHSTNGSLRVIIGDDEEIWECVRARKVNKTEYTESNWLYLYNTYFKTEDDERTDADLRKENESAKPFPTSATPFNRCCDLNYLKALNQPVMCGSGYDIKKKTSEHDDDDDDDDESLEYANYTDEKDYREVTSFVEWASPSSTLQRFKCTEPDAENTATLLLTFKGIIPPIHTKRLGKTLYEHMQLTFEPVWKQPKAKKPAPKRRTTSASSSSSTTSSSKGHHHHYHNDDNSGSSSSSSWVVGTYQIQIKKINDDDDDNE